MRPALLVALLAAACAAPPPAAPAAPPEEPAATLEPEVPLDLDRDPVAGPETFWTPAELALLDRGLAVLNATRADMGFQKRPIEDPFRLPVVDRALDDPLSVGREAESWDRVAREGDPLGLLRRAERALGTSSHRNLLLGPWEEIPLGALEERLPRGEAAPGSPEPVRHALRSFLSVAAGHGPGIQRSVPGTAAERRALLRKVLLSQVEKPARTVEGEEMDDAAFLDRVRLVQVFDLASGARSLLSETTRLVEALRAAEALPGAPRWEGRVRVGTPAGPVVLYGHGDDVHGPDGDAVLVIDLGGNDTWTRGASASILDGRPVSVAIDLSGNDRYVGREDLSFGGALGGVAIQWDGGGDDFRDGGHASLGAGLCGVGILVDEGGDDVYRSRDFGQGAGAFGIGILLDRSGNDLYHVDLFGQGFASTRGCGVLADLDGNDVYDAGGVHVHAPLYTDRFQSLSQGFSIGMRPDASGGVGVLVDARGNDRYTADIYGQGASYWYGLGILVDGDGNDTYNLGQYGQGSGIHLSAGILVDRAGSDLYYLKNGVGMGGAHDYAVGMLVDRGGDDYYAGSGGTQGGALTNSVALLFEMGGNDGFAAVNPGGAQGGASPARGTGGIGLLLDAGGKDVYTETARDGTVWTKESVGAGLDEPTAAAAEGSGDPGTTALTPERAREAVDRDGTVPGPDGMPADDLDRLWAMACRWEVGDNRVIVPVARERLAALGRPALDRALERVGTKDGLEFRAVEWTLGKFPAADSVPRLLERTREPEAAVRRGAVRALAGLRAEVAEERYVEMLATDPESRGTVLSALAALKKAPPAVAGLLRSPRESEGVQAALCLGAAGGREAVEALLGVLGPDAPFPVRLAAVDRLAGLGAGAIPALAALAGNGEAPPMARRNALRALGRSKEEAAVAVLTAALADPDPWIRLSAYQGGAELLEALGPGRGDALRRALGEARASESDPLLRRLR